ncbi:helix-turn-helix transcriptional regulator [Arthrobacter sp. PO-11]|uniref:Helix-turn-helix transcriptional regulator n=1 Tax=Arthrobacter cavernae TaxID=2817681 RepID=A0A939HGH0_9MICC|nr:helix-turn-helix transcriptional regulator [Arthrobacter cavernae]
MAELLAQQPRLTKEEAITKALGVKPSVGSQAAAKSPLTPREREIARLVAEGLSNRSIAETLVISPRTVDGHVENMLGKLGFGSRTQIAAWVSQQAASSLP